MEIKIGKFIFQSCIGSKHKWTSFAQDVCVLSLAVPQCMVAMLSLAVPVYSSYAVLGSTTVYSSWHFQE